MPFWRIYTSPDTYTAEEKQQLTDSITSHYASRGLPHFYVIVAFLPVAPADFFIGGKPVAKLEKPFVRFQVEHLARTLVGDEAQARCMASLESKLKPWTEDKDFDWEISILEGSRGLWHENGMAPPLPTTPAEKLWASENRPSMFEESQNRV